jgi:hypothetical protein
VLTRGMIWLVCKGATWPTQGLPRGTPLSVRWFQYKIWFGGAGGRTHDLSAGQRTMKLGLATWATRDSCYKNELFWF